MGLPDGYRIAAVKAGIKPSGAPDLTLLTSDRPAAAAGVFTTNRFAAAPVQWDRNLLPCGGIRAVVVNAGNANAATGAEGLANVRRTVEHTASLLGCAPGQVLAASTGVIGQQLPIERLLAGLNAAHAELSADSGAFLRASEAIMTTDTRPKRVTRSAVLGGRPVSLAGMAKGAAMIGPRMATMLGFLWTDARVEPADLDTILRAAVDESFHCIAVEGHTSTNDTVLILANGGPDRDLLRGEDLEAFGRLVREACVELARMIPEDGEGATHLVVIDVEGCRDRDQARLIARTVAQDALVKTAIHGADPNWGRIASAVGYSGADFEPEELSLWLNGTPLFQRGKPLNFDAAEVSARMRSQRETQIRIALAQGSARIRFWTCDLTAEYVRLNADYTT